VIGLRRRAAWQTALDEYLRGCASREFAYGAFDCCLFATGAVEAMTGVDLAAPLRGQYASRRTAFRACARYAGLPSVAAAAARIAAEHRLVEVHPSRAQRGDIVLLARAHDSSLALVGLDSRLLAAAARGFTAAPRDQATRAWRI
jgi:hypothetical protein